MLALFPIVEEAARSPFGVQTGRNPDSSPNALDLTDMLSDVMAVENSPGGSDRDVISPIRLRLLCQHATDQFAVVRFRLCGKSGHGATRRVQVTHHFSPKTQGRQIVLKWTFRSLNG
jgi:hypothetical protein